MKKNNYLKLKIALFVGLVALALPTTSKAQYLVYSDTLTEGQSGTSINGHAVQNSSGVLGGTLNATWNVNPGSTANYSPTGAQLSGPPTPFATLALTASASSYTLSANLSANVGTAALLGFYSSTPNASHPLLGIQDSAASGLTLFIDGVGQSLGTTGTNAVLSLSLVLNNVDDTVTVFDDGVDEGTFAFTDSGSIASVGFSAANSTQGTTISDFDLEAVPEPSSYVSGLLVLGFLAFEIRRRRMASQS